MEQAKAVYREIRSRQDEKAKGLLSVFEGRKFFRFGVSWRRLSEDKSSVLILDDSCSYLILVTPSGLIEVL